MRNKITKKIIASLMLTTLVFSSNVLTTFAMENAQGSKPILRTNSNEEFSMKLKGDISYIKSTEPVSISLRDSDVKQVLRMFADKAGFNIIFHSSVSGTVTLDLVDVPLNNAFDMIMEINELNYVVDDKTIVVAKAGASGFNLAKQDMTLVPVKYVSASAMAEFLNKNIFGMHKPGLSSSEIVTTNPATNELIIFGSKNDVAIAKKVIEKFDVKPQTTTFKVNHTTPAEMATMICSMLLPASGAGSATGGAAGIVTGGAASSGSGLALNEGTIACTVDGKAGGQVSSFGLSNLTVAYYAQLGTINIIGGSEQQLEMIKDFITTTDKKMSQAYLEISIVELNESGSRSLQNNWMLYSKAFSASFDGSTTATNPMFPVFFKGNSYDVYKAEEGSAPSLSHTISKYSGPMTISYAINYLVSNQKGRIVANPRILVTNGEETTIDITQDYIETTETEMAVSSYIPIASRTYNVGSEAGIKVNITPFISPDGYVTLNIKPEYATIKEQVKGNDGSGEFIAATLLSRRNLDLKNIRIKDGETLVLGGMIQEEERKNVGKVPVLGDIPGIGALFRSSSSEKVKTEMVIMITPKIVTDTEDAVGNTDTL